jgi:S1-C subfamily serine protease
VDVVAMKPFRPIHLRITLATILLVAVFTGVLLSQTPEPKQPPAAVRVFLETGHGSGVHIGNGYIVTATHVVGDAKKASVKTEDGRTLEAEVIWSNKDYDIALLRVDGLNISARPLHCGNPEVGTIIQTTGNPVNLEFIRTWGHVASTIAPRGTWKSTYIADVTVAGGVSGGPVYDMQQRVVGIVVGAAVQSMGITGSMVALTYVVPASAVCLLLAR